jgi:hypothetical protein
MTSARNSILLALGMGLLAGLLAALGLVLLTGSATMAATEATTPDLLPGVDLVTEEVEPGVYQVLSDGVRDLSRAIARDPLTPEGAETRSAYLNELHRGAIETDADGGVWLLWPDRFFRLGADTTAAWPKPAPKEGRYDMALHTELDPAGILYRGGPNLAGFGQASDGAGWLSFDGESWHQVPSPGDGLAITDFRVAPDSTVWAMTTPTDRGPRSFRTGKRLARLDGDGWIRISLPPAPGKDPDRAIKRWGVTDDGAVWLTRGRESVHLFHDGAWQPLGGPTEVPGAVVGPYGDVFHDGSRFQVDARGRTTEAAVPNQYRWRARKSAVEIAPDRSLWYPAAAAVDATEDPGGMPNAGCDGLARWQAGTIARYLRDTCVYDLAIAPGGAVWLQAGTWTGSRRSPEMVGPVDTYVITPEAVAE